MLAVDLKDQRSPRDGKLNGEVLESKRDPSEAAYKLSASRSLTPVLCEHGGDCKEPSKNNNWKTKKIKKVFQFCQHRQERAGSLSPSKLEGLGYYF